MKLLHRNGATLVVVWTQSEKTLLEALAGIYPVHQPELRAMSRESGDVLPEGAEAWLHAARAAELAEQRAWLAKALAPENLVATETGWQQELSADEAEWLLQILNNIRVGAWERLGRPDELPRVAQLMSQGANAHAWLMMLAGDLQMGLLLALSDPDAPAPESPDP